MAYDYTRDPAWIEFELKDRVRRENEAREKREFKIFGGGMNFAGTGEFCYVDFRGKTYFCSLAIVNTHPTYGHSEFAIFPMKNKEDVDYANPIHMIWRKDNSSFYDLVWRYFEEAQNVLQKSKN